MTKPSFSTGNAKTLDNVGHLEVKEDVIAVYKEPVIRSRPSNVDDFHIAGKALGQESSTYPVVSMSPGINKSGQLPAGVDFSRLNNITKADVDNAHCEARPSMLEWTPGPYELAQGTTEELASPQNAHPQGTQPTTSHIQYRSSHRGTRFVTGCGLKQKGRYTSS